MIRIIVKSVGVCPDGAVVGVAYRTFDIDAQRLEEFLRAHGSCYETHSIVGGELLEKDGLT